MYINGEEVKPEEMNKFFDLLQKLPSNFADIASVKVEQELTKPLQEKKKSSEENNDHLVEYIKALKKEDPEETKYNVELSKALGQIASLQAGSNKQNAIKNYEEAVRLSLKGRDRIDIAETYSNNMVELLDNNAINAKIQENENKVNNLPLDPNQAADFLVLGTLYKKQNNIEKAVENFDKTYQLAQGPVDLEAVRVEQHEVGFSSDQKIGTDNIMQCVVVIIRDPDTNKTALAHVDVYTTDLKSSMQEIMEKFPQNKTLEVSLIGGRDTSSEHSGFNLNNVRTELSKYNVNIKHSDVWNHRAHIPSAIVFDPVTGKLENAVPGKIDDTTYARKLVSRTLGNRLHQAFDLDQNDGKIIFTLTQEQYNNFFTKLKNNFPLVYQKGPLSTWQSNQLLLPLVKGCENLAHQDPHKAINAIGTSQSGEYNRISSLKDQSQTIKELSNSLNTSRANSFYKLRDSFVEKKPLLPAIQEFNSNFDAPPDIHKIWEGRIKTISLQEKIRPEDLATLSKLSEASTAVLGNGKAFNEYLDKFNILNKFNILQGINGYFESPYPNKPKETDNIIKPLLNNNAVPANGNQHVKNSSVKEKVMNRFLSELQKSSENNDITTVKKLLKTLNGASDMPDDNKNKLQEVAKKHNLILSADGSYIQNPIYQAADNIKNVAQVKLQNNQKLINNNNQPNKGRGI